MVAILEPFIDTIIICMLTGLVVLSSGVWKEKFTNDFQSADLMVLEGKYDDKQAGDLQKLSDFMTGRQNLAAFTGEVQVVDGRIGGDGTLLHARSVAEEVVVTRSRAPFKGTLQFSNGRLVRQDAGVVISGKSLLHSAPLTVEAFKKSV